MACIAPSNDDFESFPTSLLLWQLWQGTIHTFLLPLVPQNKPQDSPHLLPQAELTLPPFPQHTNKDILKRTFATTIILQKRIGFAWNPQPLRPYVQRVFF